VAIPKVAQIMGKELHWSATKINSEIDHCVKFMQSFGGPTPLKRTNLLGSEGITTTAIINDIISLIIAMMTNISSFSTKPKNESFSISNLAFLSLQMPIYRHLQEKRRKIVSSRNSRRHLF
jgi:hypothetical protein